MTRSQAKSGSTSRSRLRAFTLAEVPTELRLRAARGARLLAQADAPATDRLFAALRDLRPDGEDPIMAAAERPSERVYWIPRAAWERVMGRP